MRKLFVVIVLVILAGASYGSYWYGRSQASSVLSFMEQREVIANDLREALKNNDDQRAVECVKQYLDEHGETGLSPDPAHQLLLMVTGDPDLDEAGGLDLALSHCLGKKWEEIKEDYKGEKGGFLGNLPPALRLRGEDLNQ